MAKREYQIVTNLSNIFLVAQRKMAWSVRRVKAVIAFNDYLSVICVFSKINKLRDDRKCAQFLRPPLFPVSKFASFQESKNKVIVKFLTDNYQTINSFSA